MWRENDRASIHASLFGATLEDRSIEYTANMSTFSRWLTRRLASANGLGLVELTDHEAGRLRDDSGLDCRALLYEQALGVANASITLEEARCLGRWVRALEGDGPVIEIGTFYGWSASVMALCKAPERPLITVDNYAWTPLGLAPREKQHLTSRLLREATESLQVEIVAMDKDRYYAAYDGPPPAMVFVDAIHTYEQTKIDIEWAQKAGARMICGHDYSAQWPGVMQIVDELGGPQELVGSLWRL